MNSYNRFHQTTVEFLDFVASCIEDLRRSGFNEYNSVRVNAAKVALMNYKPTDLMNSFIANHEHWKNIMAKNEDFLFEQVPIIYKDSKIDPNLIIYPYKVFVDNRGKKCPITEEDADNMWNYFKSMVGIACNHIFNMRLSNPLYNNEIDLVSYSSSFGIALVRDK